MGIKLKPLEDQVMVITGASSGIGLVTARMAARRGARLVLGARTEESLRKLADEINENGGEALAVVCDVGNAADVRRLRDAAIERFGGFDTWYNNAGVGMFGRIVDIPVDDMKKLFETNFWGVVHGSVVAAEHFNDTRHNQRYGGALINMGSVTSYQPIPLQGPYAASKHAVKGFTDALRMELEHDGYPVSVTCIMPNAINTPYPQHAANYMDQAPTLPPPLYAPEEVARTILHAAAHPTRNVTVGGAFKPATALNNLMPGVVDQLMRALFPGQQRSESGDKGPHALYEPSGAHGEMGERGEHDRFTLPFSAYTQARLHPAITTAVLAGLGIAVTAVVNNLARDRE